MFRVEHHTPRGVFFVKAKYKKAREVEESNLAGLEFSRRFPVRGKMGAAFSR